MHNIKTYFHKKIPRQNLKMDCFTNLEMCDELQHAVWPVVSDILLNSKQNRFQREKLQLSMVQLMRPWICANIGRGTNRINTSASWCAVRGPVTEILFASYVFLASRSTEAFLSKSLSCDNRRQKVIVKSRYSDGIKQTTSRQLELVAWTTLICHCHCLTFAAVSGWLLADSQGQTCLDNRYLRHCSSAFVTLTKNESSDGEFLDRTMSADRISRSSLFVCVQHRFQKLVPSPLFGSCAVLC